MASKAPALATLTNHGGKRKAATDDGEDTAVKKLKLKSHNRVSLISTSFNIILPIAYHVIISIILHLVHSHTVCSFNN